MVGRYGDKDKNCNMAEKAFWKLNEQIRGTVNLTTKKRLLNCYVLNMDVIFGLVVEVYSKG